MAPAHKPDFLCVAPHKTGTTWLYVVLRSHPRVWVPPKKELWFLSQLDLPYWKRVQTFVAGTGMQGDIRRAFVEDVRSRLQREPFAEATHAALRWWATYLLLPYRLRYYRHVFPHRPG